VLDDHDLTSEAIEQTYQRLTRRNSEHGAELAAVPRKLTETRTVMDSYFRAFENGTMPEDTCAPPIAALSEHAIALRGRAAELAALDDTEHSERTTAATSKHSATSTRRAGRRRPYAHQDILQE
jgi:hypothetical protein